VVCEEPEIGSTDPNIPIDNNCTDHELYFMMPADSGDYDDEADKSDKRNAILTASHRLWAATGLERFDLGSSDVDGYEVKDAHNADEEEDASQADDGST